ncbi:LpqB family beta-propeller domain-containing protein [Dactylosporangium sucinum]|uniref:Lipoprotein LpqB n=1 Tax=Dactylosporangium sucinum TaxID=1424081 RepID=A0A917TRE1_9ACTN|nr:LpqB family beta-propeller domain-containing protein [Dactylosporangium sucinum]GGM34646.1 hypothetical protein GCM10007977_040170 [Dactylosporangium sucinum]
MTAPRPATRRRLIGPLAIGALLGTMLVAGCGLPGETPPKYLEPAVTANPTPDRAQQPPSPKDAATAPELVSRFLEASVGGNQAEGDEARNTTQNRMREFLTPDARKTWQPGEELEVVRATYEPQKAKDPTDPKNAGRWIVPVTMESIGILTPTGILRHAQPLTREWDAEVATVNGQLLIANPQDGLLLISSTGLDYWYKQQPVYFWESRNDNPKLVPDLRYMSTLLSRAQRVQEVLDWLRKGPSDQVAPVASALSADIDSKDVPSAGRDAVTINLGIKAVGKDEEVRRAARQIRWSLDGHPQVTLTIEGRDAGFTADGYENDNAAAGLAADSDPERFSIANMSARPVDGAGTPNLFAPGGDNTSVVSAAINRAKNRAALVRKVDKKEVLYVSTPDATTANPPKYVTTVPEVSGASLSRPVWIDRPTPMFLVSDGTSLWAVTPPTADQAQAKAEKVLGPAGAKPDSSLSLGITSLAVAPEGRRIAFVSGAAVSVAPLLFDSGKISLGVFQEVRTTLGGARSVGWITETTLAVGGVRSGLPIDQAYSLVSITVDGTAEKPLPGRSPFATAPYVIDNMSVRTADPLGPQGGVLIMFESNGIAYTVDNEGIRAVTLGPQPSASPSAQAGAPPVAKAPFYAD